tara:strand:- start:1580 stop:2755 length:1176 start_codon:yes stop_codon:yes gene_type:complete
MIYSIKPNRDTTIYEATSSMNTGIDELIEIVKTVSASTTSNTFNSRILMDFDLKTVSASVANGTIGTYPGLTTPKYMLNLYTVTAENIDYKYSLAAFPVSQSWLMGRGRTSQRTAEGGVLTHQTEGASWTYRDGKKYLGNLWASKSLVSAGSTGSFSTTVGGGTWYDSYGYAASQSFDYEKTDVRMDITNIVSKWIDGTIAQDGLIVLRSGSQQTGDIDEERNGKPYGSLQFFSTDTHTVYQPKLEVIWKETTVASTLSILDTTLTESIVDIKNMKTNYQQASREQFRLVVREKFPAKTYDTVSAALTNNRLPAQTFYSVRDYVTDETVIPYDNPGTQLSADNNGNYFNLWMDQFYPGRRYRFVFKTVGGSYNFPTSQSIFDNDYIFKVIS